MFTKDKNLFQTFVSSIKWSHSITVEPFPGFPMNNNEMCQRMRQIEFNLNKRCLKSSFPKWDMPDRFFMMWSAEGGAGTGQEKHFHLLLHSPDQLNSDDISKLLKNGVEDYIKLEWWKLPRADNIPSPPLHISKVRSNIAASIYTTKQHMSHIQKAIKRTSKIQKEEIHGWGFLKI